MKHPFSATGHRPNKLYDAYPERPGYKLLVSFAEYCINKYINEIDSFGSGMALGWDMAVAQACINLDISLIACVPFKGQECQWPTKTQNYYNLLLSKAAQVIYVCEAGYAAWKMQKRNEFMVDNSHKQLALWNGTKGGTANCVKYANDKEIEVINVWQEYEAGLLSLNIKIQSS